MRVVTAPKKPHRPRVLPKAAAPFLERSVADRPPGPQDNPRHVVWITDQEPPRLVTVRTPGDARVTVAGVVYHHTHEDREGRWIYSRGIDG